MTIYDITLPIRPEMVTWPGQPGVAMRYLSRQQDGDRATVTHISLSLHTGTHVDATNHFLPDGTGVEQLDLTTLIGPALVVEAMDAAALTAAVFESLAIPPGTDRLLVHTLNSALWARGVPTFQTDYVAVTADGAQWLVDHGVRLIGVDYLSVAVYDDLTTPHEILLRANMVIVEGLNLHGIAPGSYQFVCLPLPITGRDGSPARAVLIAD